MQIRVVLLLVIHAGSHSGAPGSCPMRLGRLAWCVFRGYVLYVCKRQLHINRQQCTAYAEVALMSDGLCGFVEHLQHCVWPHVRHTLQAWH